MRPTNTADGRQHRARGRLAARRMQIGHVRAAVRTHLAESQRRRQELSEALVGLRRGLLEFRSQLRTRLREMTHGLASKHAKRS